MIKLEWSEPATEFRNASIFLRNDRPSTSSFSLLLELFPCATIDGWHFFHRVSYMPMKGRGRSLDIELLEKVIHLVGLFCSLDGIPFHMRCKIIIICWLLECNLGCFLSVFAPIILITYNMDIEQLVSKPSWIIEPQGSQHGLCLGSIHVPRDVEQLRSLQIGAVLSVTS